MKTAVVFPPGAARTAYQVGAVSALVDAGIRFDVVACSSVGTLNGAFVATGQVDRLVELWSGWRTPDIMGTDWREIVRGAVFRSRNLMHNRPQRDRVIRRYIREEALLPGIRFRFNLADLGTGKQRVFEWPGAPMPLAPAVNASVAVPAAIRPVHALGTQWADGLTVDGFPLEELLAGCDIDRVFVLGVAPGTFGGDAPANAIDALLRAAQCNQYDEIWSGLEHATALTRLIESWDADRVRVEAAIEELVDDADQRSALLRVVDDTYGAAGFPLSRRPWELIPILPENEIRMFFTDYHPERSRQLIEAGRRDAEATLARAA